MIRPAKHLSTLIHRKTGYEIFIMVMSICSFFKLCFVIHFGGVFCIHDTIYTYVPQNSNKKRGRASAAQVQQGGFPLRGPERARKNEEETHKKSYSYSIFCQPTDLFHVCVMKNPLVSPHACPSFKKPFHRTASTPHAFLNSMAAPVTETINFFLLRIS